MTAWIAACAILLASLAPAISHAMAMNKGGPDASFAGTWTEICTVAGSKYVQVDGAGKVVKTAAAEPSLAGKLMHLEHCPFCTLHVDQPALITADLTPSLPQAGLDRLLPPLFLQARRTLFAWAGAQARAPPAAA